MLATAAVIAALALAGCGTAALPDGFFGSSHPRGTLDICNRRKQVAFSFACTPRVRPMLSNAITQGRA
jgi:hypothetical protein